MKIRNASVTFGTALLLAAGVCTAQTPTKEDAIKTMDKQVDLLRKDLRDAKKQLVAANLPLSGDEAAKFWPGYDSYTQDTMKLNDQRYALIKDYAAAYDNITDANAGKFIRQSIGIDQSASQLRLKWMPKFEQTLGAKKAAMFFQIDRRIALMMDLQLAAEIPLVEPQ